MFIAEGLRDVYLQRVTTILAWTCIVLVLLSAIALGANRPVSWTLLSLFIAILFVGHIIFDMWKGFPDGLGRVSLIVLLFLGAVCWGIVQTMPNLPEAYWHPVWSGVVSEYAAISADPIRGHHHIMRLLCYGMLFWIGMRVAADVERSHSVVKLIAIFSTLLALFGLYAFMTGSNAIVGDRANGRYLVSTFANRNSYASYAIIGVIANLMCYFEFFGSDSYGSRGGRLRNFFEDFFAGSWIYAMGVLICLAAIALTSSRAGAVAAGIGLLVFWVSFKSKGSNSNPIVMVVLLLAVVFVVATQTSGLTERLLTTSEENLRFEVYPAVIAGIWERPLLGHGLGAFLDAFRAQVPFSAAKGEWDYAHNAFLENVYELGIPAASAFYLALLLIAWRLWRGTRERQRDRGFVCFAFACCMALGFHSIFDFSLQMPATAALFALVLGIGWTHSFSARTVAKSKSRKKVKTATISEQPAAPAS